MTTIIHDTASISSLCKIDDSTRGSSTYIGAHTQIDDFVKIKHVGGTADIKIGKYVYINSCTVLYSGNGIIIGDNVLFGPNCSLVPVNHTFTDKVALIREQGFQESRGGIIIEDDVWIGANVTILDGAIIRKGAIIGANSLVNKEITAYSINHGSPTKQVGMR